MAFMFAVVAAIEGHAGSQKRPVSLQADHFESVLVDFASPQNLSVGRKVDFKIFQVLLWKEFWG